MYIYIQFDLSLRKAQPQCCVRAHLPNARSKFKEERDDEEKQTS